MHFETGSVVHIFDCDGVLLDSNQAKIKALTIAMKTVSCPDEYIEWASQEFRQNFGRSRKGHFDAFQNYKGIPNFQLGSDDADLALECYTNQVIDLYTDCEVISESLDYLERIYEYKDIHVVSASNEIELRKILPFRIPAISSGNIYGGPTSKIDNINYLLGQNPGKQMVFYGDAIKDAQAAIATGVSFIGLSKYAADSLQLEQFCNEQKLKCVRSLEEMSFS